MSWKVYGAMLPGSLSKQFGPLPKKRWVPRPFEKYRVSRPSVSYRNPASPKDYNEGRAIMYARWLAARDGDAIDANRSGTIFYNTFMSAISGKLIRRIEAVYFGRRRVTIPHWDFEPREPVEDSAPPCPVPPPC